MIQPKKCGKESGSGLVPCPFSSSRATLTQTVAMTQNAQLLRVILTSAGEYVRDQVRSPGILHMLILGKSSMSGGGTEQAYFNSYSPFFQEVTDRQLASSPQDSYSPVSPGPLTGSENASWLLTLWRMFLLVLFDNCRYFFLVEKRRNQDGWMNGW